MSFWETQRQIATSDLIATGLSIGLENRAAKKRQVDAQQHEQEMSKIADNIVGNMKKRYDIALEIAKRTGEMEVDCQRTVPEDRMGEEMGVKTVALRELGKHNPNHPLIRSKTVQKFIGLHTIRNYSRADRPAAQNYGDFAPSDESCQNVYLNKGNEP